VYLRVGDDEMKIKEVVELTKISAKAIRLYEDKGLINPERNNNNYRCYTTSDIETLRTIKILRNLDTSIDDIKLYFNADLGIKKIIETHLEKVKSNKERSENRLLVLEVLSADINKNENFNLNDYYDDIEFISCNEYDEYVQDLKSSFNSSLFTVIIQTFALSGPLLWYPINLSNEQYDLLGWNVLAIVVCTVLTTLIWRSYLSQEDKEVKGTIAAMFAIIVALFVTLVLFVGISSLQQTLFVPSDYLMFDMKTPYSYLLFVLEVELLFILYYLVYKKNSRSKYDYIRKIMSFIKEHLKVFIATNLFILYVIITSVWVITPTSIHSYSYYNPTGKSYRYNDITMIKTGFELKGKNKGEFYYKITLDSKELDIVSSQEIYDDTYLALEEFDNLIAGTGVPKLGSSQGYEHCDLANKYCERFKRITEK